MGDLYGPDVQLLAVVARSCYWTASSATADWLPSHTARVAEAS